MPDQDPIVINTELNPEGIVDGINTATAAIEEGLGKIDAAFKKVEESSAAGSDALLASALKAEESTKNLAAAQQLAVTSLKELDDVTKKVSTSRGQLTKAENELAKAQQTTGEWSIAVGEKIALAEEKRQRALVANTEIMDLQKAKTLQAVEANNLLTDALLEQREVIASMEKMPKPGSYRAFFKENIKGATEEMGGGEGYNKGQLGAMRVNEMW
jgi:predicted  nucleic acid-binding Zn-ribbon protein